MTERIREQAARILVVDDHPVMRRGLGKIINDQPDLHVCGEAGDVEEALRMLEQTDPDLVIVDVSLGDGNGIELIKKIKSHRHDARILVASMHDETLFAERSIRAGALGYINKHEPAETFHQAIQRVLDGRIYLSPRMTERLLHQITSPGEEPGRSPIDRLSDRELEVFEMIGQGLTTKQIAAKLHLSSKTVETYRENIKAKLKLNSGAELTRHAVQWVLEES